MYRFVFCAVVVSGFGRAYAENNTEPYRRMALRHIESGGIGYEEGYTTLEAFVASDPSRWVANPFLDVRAHMFNNGKWAANLGVGVRTLWGSRAYGLNTYYDYRNTRHLRSNQIGLGFETLGELFDFRINGYLPVGTKISHPYDAAFKKFVGHSMFVSQKYQSAMKGIDAEFGFHLGKSKAFDFYTAAGPYYFIGKKARATWGGKARFVGTFKEILSLEISDSYDPTFHNKFQGQISLSFAFGPKSKIKKKLTNKLNDCMWQPVGRQEIIVIDKVRKNTLAIDPATGLPYFFVFVDNTSSSEGTYESPYHSLAQAEKNSSPNDIIYVYPGDGTTKGMDSGIALKINQKFWGSGINQSIQTTAGVISIPAQSSASPNITNTNINTDGNAITLANNNAISGLIITSAMNDAIYGVDLQENLTVSSCVFKNTTTYAIEASFSGDTSISLTNNQLVDNINGVLLTLNGTSTVVCLDNTFTGQTSTFTIPLEISANNNTLAAHIENNIFDSNTTGSLMFDLNDVVSADITVVNNRVTNNQSGNRQALGSSLVIIPNGTITQCSLTLKDNTFSGNEKNNLYLQPFSGAFTTLEATVSNNTFSDNGGSSLVFATPVDNFTLVATDNTIVGNDDNGIAVISAGTTTTGTITINNNIITDIGNASNGIAINQDFSILNLTLLNNEINRCEGTGIVSYAPTGIDFLKCNISDNTIRGCQNLFPNAAPGLDLERYTNLTGSITNNILSDNTGTAVFIGSNLVSPTACLSLSGNNSTTDYLLTNPVDGLFNLSPCNVDTINTGTIITTGTINHVKSCSDPTLCPP